MDLVRDLAEVGAADRAAVGGKAASLGELASAGARVPPGFVVTTGAFGLAMAAIDPDGSGRQDADRDPDWDAGRAPDRDAGRDPDRDAGRDPDRAGGRAPGRDGGRDPDRSAARIAASAGAAGRMRERILAGSPPDAVTAEIGRRYRALGGSAAVAVRSSATFEDGGDASFAGVQDTYLWVRGEAEVIGSVQRCWASLYGAESVSYRRRLQAQATGPGSRPPAQAPGLGAVPEPPAMAVVIQQMVDARCAGVMFTCGPTTGDRSVVAVEAAWGLGSAMVSGSVTPDSYVVSKVTGEIVKQTVPAKLRQHQRGPDGCGVVETDVPAHLQQAPCLTGEEVAELVSIARQIEEHYGTPQDIEWAIADGQGILVLQSRPETVWAGRETTPVAVPKRRAFDHVFDRMSGSAPGGNGGTAR